MTSLIDVIFLLLLFFMLSSTFSRFAEVELAAAGAGGNGSSDAKISFLRLSDEGLSLNGREVELDGLSAAFAEMPASDEARPVVVSLRDGVTSQRLTDLLVVLRGIERVSISVLGS
ncbi:biopolymer transporter ExbD [Roseovarius atlanticus]|uniref:Biopolymer transporter ExbD n=2 Tax=Roseovarius atlanticus TaxID=1641875 RepID=A0A0T5NUZ9_9RHOB|nr:biopolymer transporter ExbD [Roseovarius atlanticus]